MNQTSSKETDIVTAPSGHVESVNVHRQLSKSNLPKASGHQHSGASSNEARIPPAVHSQPQSNQKGQLPNSYAIGLNSQVSAPGGGSKCRNCGCACQQQTTGHTSHMMSILSSSQPLGG